MLQSGTAVISYSSAVSNRNYLAPTKRRFLVAVLWTLAAGELLSVLFMSGRDCSAS
jgi:hypothetical protein